MKMNTRLLFIFLLVSGQAAAQDIFRSACQGNIPRLDSLLQYDSLMVEDSRGRSLLHWAVGCGQRGVFDFLVEQGMDINQSDSQNKTAMYVALHSEREDFFDLLLSLQSNTNWLLEHGTPLLELAILKKSQVFVQKLLQLGVSANQTNLRGSTPLEIAQRVKAPEIYELIREAGGDESQIRQISPKGAYMGQKPPGLTPQLFAPNFISTEESEFGCVFNAAGTVFYYAVDVNGRNEIRYSQLQNNTWTPPKVLLSHERYGYNDPFLSPNEDRLYFISKQALDGVGEPKDVDIWYVQKEAQGWSQPIHAGPQINTEGNEYYISITQEGTLYFASNHKSPEERKGYDYDIYFSPSVEGVFQPAQAMSDAINTEGYEADAFIAPDASYLIFCSRREGSYGRGDLYISFQNEDHTWTPAINMGPQINTSFYEYCPFVSADGKYLFYTSNQDIYWISTDIIANLEEKVRKK